MVVRPSSDEGRWRRRARTVPFATCDTPAMREWAEQLVERVRAEGVEVTGDDSC